VQELTRLCPKEHGAIVLMTATITSISLNNLTLYALAQRRGPAVHTFITTCGSFVQQIPARFPKVTKLEDAQWTTPSIWNTFT
jgi:hypothetical protein